MKIVLASYFEPENHGSGRKIGLSNKKPDNLEYDCEVNFDSLAPERESYWSYFKEKKTDPDGAGKRFVDAYDARLREFVDGVKKTALEQNKTVFEVLPLKEGDTLLSWEKKGHTTYRAITALFLRELGYEVEEN